MSGLYNRRNYTKLAQTGSQGQTAWTNLTQKQRDLFKKLDSKKGWLKCLLGTIICCYLLTAILIVAFVFLLKNNVKCDTLPAAGGGAAGTTSGKSAANGSTVAKKASGGAAKGKAAPKAAPKASLSPKLDELIKLAEAKNGGKKLTAE